jgi:UDP-2-acetamido-3-amino-2,3-dideoxy-glucuronate N-acetyltransferase
MNYSAHSTACIDQPCIIGDGTKIWHFCHVCAGAQIGQNCSLGQNVFVAGGAVVGSNVKIQNNVSVYDGVTLQDDVFLGPSCVLTNVTNPRSQVVRRGLYEKTLIRRGAAVGANATVVCGITLGRYAFIAAGAVATKDVPDYALVVGILLPTPDKNGIMVCPESGWRYQEVEPEIVRCLDWDEEKPLPAEKAIGTRQYDDFKR